MTAASPGPAPATPGRYRKRPVVIEAVQWHEHGDDPDVVPYPDVRPDAAPCDECPRPLEDHGWIRTLEDGHRVCPADWLITGVKGERYPCKPDIFAATYDPAASGGQDATPGQAAYERLASRVAAIAENLYESAAATHPSRKSEIQRDTADRIRQALAEPAECPVCAEIGSPHGVPQPAPEKPELLGHPDDAAEEWLAETYEPDDANAVGYGRSEMIDAWSGWSDWARGQIAKFGQDENGRWRALEPQPAPELAAVERERDSLARRCAVRFEETQELRAVVAEMCAHWERIGTTREEDALIPQWRQRAGLDGE